MGAVDGHKRRKYWGWGYEGEGPNADQRAGIAKTLASRFGTELDALDPPGIDDLDLRPPRVRPPDVLAALCRDDPETRAGHTYGKSYRDVVRGFHGAFPNPPDLVTYPATEDDVVAILDWCADAGVAAIPYGGGSSVVGGVEAPADGDWAGVVSVDLSHLDRVIEVDAMSRAARIQAGVLGPALDDQLRPHGYTMRHFPQSYEFSSLGGWIATRSGGHYATLYTHIDDFVESLRVVTPRGVVESRRLPGSGAGPSPDRLFIGSEGTLGVITEAWMRIQDRPRFRASGAARFSSFEAGAAAARALAQSGLFPTNCRLLDPTEALVTGTDDGTKAVLVVGFESADHPLDSWMARAVECCRDHGGEIGDDVIRTRTDDDAAREGAVGAWRRSFLNAPYLRDVLVSLGVVTDTFETSITWDRFEAFHAGVTEATLDAMGAVGLGGGWITCRFTHVYPDGPAPYYTFLGPGRRGAELDQWAAVKEAAGDAIIRLGGTITHHHAVGRDHRRWYDQQRPPLWVEAFTAAKRTLDPTGMLNPGVLIDAGRAD